MADRNALRPHRGAWALIGWPAVAISPGARQRHRSRSAFELETRVFAPRKTGKRRAAAPPQWGGLQHGPSRPAPWTLAPLALGAMAAAADAGMPALGALGRMWRCTLALRACVKASTLMR